MMDVDIVSGTVAFGHAPEVVLAEDAEASRLNFQPFLLSVPLVSY